MINNSSPAFKFVFLFLFFIFFIFFFPPVFSLAVVLAAACVASVSGVNISFAAEISERNLDCELRANVSTGAVLSGSLFGMAQQPSVQGWFAAEFDVRSDAISISSVHPKRYEYVVVGGLATEPINRRLAVVRNKGIDVYDFVDRKLLLEFDFPACFAEGLSGLSELHFDASTAKLYALSFTKLSADGVSCNEPKPREALLEIDLIDQKLRLVAEIPVCTIATAVSAIDFVNSYYYMFGYKCQANGSMMPGGDDEGTIYRIALASDGAATGKAEVKALPAPSHRIGLLKFALSQTFRTGKLYVLAHLDKPTFDWSLGTYEPETGAVTKLSSNAVRYSSILLDAPSSIDGPNDVFIHYVSDLTGSSNAFDFLSLGDGTRKFSIKVTEIAGASLQTGNGTAGLLSGVGTINLAPECVCCIKDGAAVEGTSATGGATQATQAAATTTAGATTAATTAENNATAPAGTPGAPAPAESTTASTVAVSTGTTATAPPPTNATLPGPVRKRKIAALSEMLVKQCDASKAGTNTNVGGNIAASFLQITVAAFMAAVLIKW